MLDFKKRPVTTRPDAAVAESMRPNRAECGGDELFRRLGFGDVAHTGHRLDRGAHRDQLLDELRWGVAEHEVVVFRREASRRGAGPRRNSRR